MPIYSYIDTGDASGATGKPLRPADEAEREYDEETIALAREVLDNERVSLMMAFRFFNAALWAMPHEHLQSGAMLATDGKKLAFDAGCVLDTFRKDENEVARAFLQVVLHCIFRHPFDDAHEDAHAWSLACDICAESIALEMCRTRFVCEGDAERRAQVERLAAMVGTLTPFKLYTALLTPIGGHTVNDAGFSINELQELSRLFMRDNHGLWACFRDKDPQERPMPRPEGVPDVQNTIEKQSDIGNMSDDATDTPDSAAAGQKESSEQNDSQAGEGEADNSDSADNSGESPDAEQGQQNNDAGESAESKQASEQSDAGDQTSSHSDPNNQTDGASQPDTDDGLPDLPDFPHLPQPGDVDDAQREAEERWREIGREVEMDLEAFSQRAGHGSNGLMTNLRVANRREVDYGDFLRRFCALSEDNRINDDEFDYIFYTLGLERYGNMPLVEPLEYKECNLIRDFVVVIDTSGSCSGRLVKAFIEQTYDILSTSGSFGAKTNIHIVQADDKVQSDTKITSIEQLEDYRDSFWIKGHGGTDFRPAFEYVQNMLDEGEFADLKGLIYFTDGLGTFPAKMPGYECAFVFVDDDGQKRAVPPWAMKVIVSSEQLARMRPSVTEARARIG